MQGLIDLLGAALLFAAGLRMSAFFSGCEIGFYRVSFLRVSLEANAGDPAAQRIRWFTQHPSTFVATALVGNNVAHYLASLAVGLGAVALFPQATGWVEIVSTLLATPVIFVFGEMLPKNLFYRAPLALLRKNILAFRWFYFALLPASYPLMGLARFVARLGGAPGRQPDLLLGRTQLVQVLTEGHREGLLLDVQSRLVHGLLDTAAQSLHESLMPTSRILGLPDDASRTQILEFARRYGLHRVPVHRVGQPSDWHGYVRVVDATIDRRPIPQLIRPAPRIEATGTKLEALLALRHAGSAYGVVHDGGKIVGLVSEHGLVEQLFRPPRTTTREPAP